MVNPILVPNELVNPYRPILAKLGGCFISIYAAAYLELALRLELPSLAKRGASLTQHLIPGWRKRQLAAAWS
jgi:hypothetical protein